MDIRNKIFIVSGGANGLGKAITLGLVDCGARVTVIDKDQESMKDFDRIKSVICYKCNFLIPNEIENVFKKINIDYPIIDGLINNAGIIHSEPIFKITSIEKRHSIDTWNNVISINLSAPFILSSYLIEKMVLNRTKGVIVNITSISSKGNVGQSAYSASKAGMESMTRVWSKELGVFGIRVFAIAPGFIETDSMHSALSKNMKDEIRNKIPLKIFGKYSNVSKLVISCIENDYISGSTLSVDGGLVI
jgi:3-oxoacyl-[acyl-carrier protein] reductase